MRIHLFNKHLFSAYLLNTLYVMPGTVLGFKDTIVVERREPDKTPYPCTAYCLVGRGYFGGNVSTEGTENAKTLSWNQN